MYNFIFLNLLWVEQFQDGSRISQRRGGVNLLFGHILPKTTRKWRKLDSDPHPKFCYLYPSLNVCSERLIMKVSNGLVRNYAKSVRWKHLKNRKLFCTKRFYHAMKPSRNHLIRLYCATKLGEITWENIAILNGVWARKLWLNTVCWKAMKFM